MVSGSARREEVLRLELLAIVVDACIFVEGERMVRLLVRAWTAVMCLPTDGMPKGYGRRLKEFSKQKWALWFKMIG